MRCMLLVLALLWAFSPQIRAAESLNAVDARAAEAQALVYRGELDAAEQLWSTLADTAQTAGDLAALDVARLGLANTAFLRGQYNTVQALHTARLEEAHANGNLRIEADARMELAVLQRRQGHLDDARVGLEEALNLFRQARDRNGEGQALTHLGLVLINQGAFARALESLDSAFALQRDGADVPVDRAYHYLGIFYIGLHDYAEARSQLERGLQAALALPDPMRASPLLGTLARTANEQGLHQDALDFTTRATTLSTRFKSTPGLAFSALERGRALAGLNRLEEARAALEEARRLSLSITQDRTAADATFVLGRVALRDGQQDTALALFNEALPNYEAAGDVPQTLSAYRAMIPLLREQGNLPESLRLAEAALGLQEQLGGREAARRIALIEHRHHVADSARQIELLTRENEIQQLRLQRQSLERRVTLGLIGGLLLIAALLASAYQRSRRIRAALQRSNEELIFSRRALATAHNSLEEKARELEMAACTDPLTGLANRRHVLDMLSRVAQSAKTHRRSLAVLLFDVDRFKQINDTHGHGVGDRVLCRVGHVLQALTSNQGMLGRYGGEEFLMVLPDHDLQAAAELAEHALQAVAASREGDDPAVTLSIGVAARSHGGIVEDAAHLIEEADRALYRAKDAGRNRIELA